MRRLLGSVLVGSFGLAVLAGCVSVPKDAGFPDVKDLLKDQQGHYEDTVQKFFEVLKKRAELEEIDIKSSHVKFPRAANKVREQIKRLKPSFRDLGIKIDIAPYTQNDGKHPKNRQVIYIDENKNTISYYGEK